MVVRTGKRNCIHERAIGVGDRVTFWAHSWSKSHCRTGNGLPRDQGSTISTRRGAVSSCYRSAADRGGGLLRSTRSTETYDVVVETSRKEALSGNNNKTIHQTETSSCG